MFRDISVKSGDGDEAGVSGDGGGKKKFGRRLSAALSRVDFEYCDPPTCVSILHVASIQVLCQ